MNDLPQFLQISGVHTFYSKFIWVHFIKYNKTKIEQKSFIVENMELKVLTDMNYKPMTLLAQSTIEFVLFFYSFIFELRMRVLRFNKRVQLIIHPYKM